MQNFRSKFQKIVENLKFPKFTKINKNSNFFVSYSTLHVFIIIPDKFCTFWPNDTQKEYVRSLLDFFSIMRY